eukprot:Mycagemm_TRINITY_DN10089_c0_g1::TRINITY_DN10089_c0_g1_i1::g.2019::m.2019 type:complete len:172 gc:universal TRINITY_DN10089_c0_g1_i1:331-846(+)
MCPSQLRKRAPVRASQAFTVQSIDAVITIGSVGCHRRCVIASWCLQVRRGCMMFKSHTRIVPSIEPDAARGRVLQKPTDSTVSVWPCKAPSDLPVLMFTMQVRPSAPPVMIKLPSWWKPIDTTGPSWNMCPETTNSTAAVFGFQMRTVPSSLPVTTFLPSMENPPHVHRAL